MVVILIGFFSKSPLADRAKNRRNSLRNVDLEIVLARDAGPLSAQQQWIFDKTLQHHAAESVMRRIETQQTAEVPKSGEGGRKTQGVFGYASK